MKKILYILVILCSCNSFFAKIPESQKMALIDLYWSTKGDNWTNSWDLSKEVTTWLGVEIKEDKVVSLSLVNNNLKGTLPESLGDLKNLKVLNLAFNSIHDELPASIVKLKKLIVLRLGKNKIKGSIEDITNLKNLVVLDLFANKFSGILPKTLFQLKKIKVILLSNNNITGRIPEDIQNLKALERFEISDNNIYGDVPDKIGSLSNLKMLVLSENRLSGKFPSVVFSLPNLKVLQLQRNSFDRTHIKNSIPAHTNLATFDFDNDINQFNRMEFRNIFRKANSRMADTRFEEDKDNK